MTGWRARRAEVRLSHKIVSRASEIGRRFLQAAALKFAHAQPARFLRSAGVTGHALGDLCDTAGQGGNIITCIRWSVYAPGTTYFAALNELKKLSAQFLRHFGDATSEGLGDLQVGFDRL